MAESAKSEDYFIPAGKGSHHAIFPGIEIVTTAGKAIMLSVVTFEPNAIVPMHSHPHEQMGIMISGNAIFTVGGIEKTLGPGDIWRIPGGVPHKVVGLDGPAVALDVFHPIREDYR